VGPLYLACRKVFFFENFSTKNAKLKAWNPLFWRNLGTKLILSTHNLFSEICSRLSENSNFLSSPTLTYQAAAVRHCQLQNMSTCKATMLALFQNLARFAKCSLPVLYTLKWRAIERQQAEWMADPFLGEWAGKLETPCSAINTLLASEQCMFWSINVIVFYDIVGCITSLRPCVRTPWLVSWVTSF